MYWREHTLRCLLILFFPLLLLPISTYALSAGSDALEGVTDGAEMQIQEESNSNTHAEASSQNKNTTEINYVQIITSCGVIATAILGTANLVASVRKIHIDGISNKRSQWIESVRNITAGVVCYDLRKIKNTPQFEKEYGEFLKNAYRLSLHLNIQGPFDRVVSDYLIEFVKSQHQCSDDFVHNRRMLNFAVQVYLKSEWDRVKCESSINPFKKYNEKKSIMSILGSLKGDYVNELKTKYTNYLHGGIMDAPVFFEYIEVS